MFGNDLPDNIAAMRAGVDFRIPVRCRKFSVMLRPLSMMEEAEVTSEATEAIRALPSTHQNAVQETATLAIKTLVKASTSDVDKNDPKLSEYELKRWTIEEINFFYKEYIKSKIKVSPMLEEMSQVELKSLVDELKKKALEQPEELALALTERTFSEILNVCLSLIKDASQAVN